MLYILFPGSMHKTKDITYTSFFLLLVNTHSLYEHDGASFCEAMLNQSIWLAWAAAGRKGLPRYSFHKISTG